MTNKSKDDTKAERDRKEQERQQAENHGYSGSQDRGTDTLDPKRDPATSPTPDNSQQ
jgi:hypothetical protein